MNKEAMIKQYQHFQDHYEQALLNVKEAEHLSKEWTIKQIAYYEGCLKMTKKILEDLKGMKE